MTQRPSLRLPDAAYADLAALARAADSLRVIAEMPYEAFDATDPGRASDVISARTGILRSDAHSVVRALMALHALRRSLNANPTELTDLLHRSVDEFATREWKNKYYESWKTAVSALPKLLVEDHPVELFEKAVRLRFAFQNILTNVELFTDIRPIFDEPGEAVKAATVSYTLSVEYSDSHRKRIDFALDAEDVAKLKALCERAERKTETIMRSFSDTRWLGSGDERGVEK